MQRANLMEQEGNDPRIAAVVRTMDIPLGLRPPPRLASCFATLSVVAAILYQICSAHLWRSSDQAPSVTDKQ
jgi:hypothetical protein